MQMLEFSEHIPEQYLHVYSVYIRRGYRGGARGVVMFEKTGLI